MSPTQRNLTCPKGHRVTPANLSCMKRAGYYWCGKCVLDPDLLSMAGGPVTGAYYAPSKVREASA